MKMHLPKYPRILGIAVSKYGLGYAVMKDVNVLFDWGVKWVRKDRDRACLAKVKRLMAHYEPHIVALEDTLAKGSLRPARIRNLTRRIVFLVKSCKVAPAIFSRQEMKRAYFPGGEATRHNLAMLMAERFADDIGHLLPPKRKAWMVEHPRLAMFDAVALASMVRLSWRK